MFYCVRHKYIVTHMQRVAKKTHSAMQRESQQYIRVAGSFDMKAILPGCVTLFPLRERLQGAPPRHRLGRVVGAMHRSDLLY